MTTFVGLRPSTVLALAACAAIALAPASALAPPLVFIHELSDEDLPSRIALPRWLLSERHLDTDPRLGRQLAPTASRQQARRRHVPQRFFLPRVGLPEPPVP